MDGPLQDSSKLIQYPTVSEINARVVLDRLPLGAMVVDSGLNIQEWNRTLVEWSGISSEIASGLRLTDLFPNVKDPRYLKRLKEVFETGLPATYSAAFHRHFLQVPARHGLDCEWMIQQTDVRSLSSANDRVIITIQDVSYQYVQLNQLRAEQRDLMETRDALAQSNDALVQRNAELDDFAKVASHDLQEPLRSIVHLVMFLEEDCAESLDDIGKEHLSRMTDAADRMSSLIRDILLLSRTGTQKLEHQTHDLNLIVREVIEFLDVAIRDSETRFKIPELPKISCDPRLISQTFQNLIGNAVKFGSEQSPVVEVTVEQSGDKWVFGVRDNGIGIDPKYAEKIFQPFERLHGRQEYGGTGIGLAICRKAIASHGGRIWVDSEKGAGAHFKFELPV